MTDLEDLLRSALKTAGETYRPPDPIAARERFFARRRRRWIVIGASSVAVAGAAAVAFFMFGPSALETVTDDGITTAATTPQVTGTIQVGLGPSGIAVAGGEVWTANISDTTISRIDVSTGTVIDHYRVGGKPEDVVVGEGAVWIANETVIQRLEPGTGKLEPIEIETSPSHIDLALGDGALFTFSGDDNVTKIDTETRRTVRRESVVDRPGDIATGEGFVWVLGDEGRTLYRLDPADITGESFEIPGHSEDNDLAVGGGAVWVAHGDEGLVYRIDPETGAITGPPGDVAGDFAGIAVGPDALWVLTGSSAGPDKLWRLSLDDADQLGAPILLNDSADVAVGAGAAWVTDIADDSVVRVELVPAGDLD